MPEQLNGAGSEGGQLQEPLLAQLVSKSVVLFSQDGGFEDVYQCADYVLDEMARERPLVDMLPELIRQSNIQYVTFSFAIEGSALAATSFEEFIRLFAQDIIASEIDRLYPD